MSRQRDPGGKTAALGLVLLLLFLAIAGGATLIYGGVFDRDGPWPDPPSADPGTQDAPGLSGTGRKPTESLAGAERPAEEAATREVPTPAGTDGSGAAVETDPLAEESPPRQRAAVRRSPHGRPKRRPGRRFGPTGGGGSGGPTGHWTRFGPFPQPKGTARIDVTVQDEAGSPVVGAEVYLGPPEVAGVDGISFGDLRKLGKTDASGVLVARALPDGRAAVLGNFNNRLNGRWGLDGRHGRKTTLRAGTKVAVRIQLPLAVGAVGTVRGRVLDPGGSPITSASVTVGYNRIWSDKQGAFVLAGIPAGEAHLSVSATGFAPASIPLEVVAGKTTTRDVELTYADSGPTRIEGRVTGPEGEVVAGATVYLMMTKERGTLRRARTDATGGFVLEELPERVRKDSARLQASRFPHYASRVVTFGNGVHDERVNLQLPVRYVQLRVRVLDAATGEPIPQLNAHAERPESARPKATLSFDRETGCRRGMVEAGRHTIRIDALDHEDLEFQLDVEPDAEWRCEHEVRLKRIAPESVQVALTLRITEAVSGTPVSRARIEVLEAEAGSPAVARFEGRREDGEYRMPAPSGTRRLVITAAGYEPYGRSLDLKRTEPEVELEVQLTPR